MPYVPYAWVKEHARNLMPESVAAFSDKIRTCNMNAEMAGERRERLGIAADPAFAHAVSLNDLDHWDQARRRLSVLRVLRDAKTPEDNASAPTLSSRAATIVFIY